MYKTIISYCCGTYPNIGGVARYDTQLKLLFPDRIFFMGPEQKNEMLFFLESKQCINPIVIADNHLSIDIPNNIPVLLVHHGCALTHAEREINWEKYWRDLCCNGQNKMLEYRKPNNTWIISISSFCYYEFYKYYKEKYTIFKNISILHSSEFNEYIYKTKFNLKPIVLGNWSTEHKGRSIINKINKIHKSKSHINFIFNQLNILPTPLTESIESFNKRKQEIYLRSDIFFQLSVSEGNSYATLDALLCGLVVVASNVGLFYKDVPDDCFVKIEWERIEDIDYILERLNYAWVNREYISVKGRIWYLENCGWKDWKNKMNSTVNDFYKFNYN